MSQKVAAGHSLRKLFRATVDRAFREHRDLYTPDVASHLGDGVLTEFVHVDRLYRLRNAAGRKVEDLAEMVETAHENEGLERRLEVDRYIGDFVLFMGAFFPGSLGRRGWRDPRPMVSRVGGVLVSFTRPMDYYLAEGSNAYSRAAATSRLFDPVSHHTFHRLGAHFERYLGLLSRVKSLLGDAPKVREIEAMLEEE